MFQVTKHSNSRQSTIRRTSRSLLLSAVVGLTLSVAFAGTALANEVGNDPLLAKLEVKYFYHDYAKDDTASRLERLEKMLFGEAKTGSQSDRLKALIAAVPNLNKVEQKPAATADRGAARPAVQPAEESNEPLDEPQTANRPSSPAPKADSNLPGQDYPAATAIERKVLGRDFASEPINKRIERLELKVLGKTVPSDALSERLDRLKQRTGVDIAKYVPPGSDWADDDEPGGRGTGELVFTPEPTPFRSAPRSAPPGEDGRTFSGRDLRKEMEEALGRPVTRSSNGIGGSVGGSGSYGMGGRSSGYSPGGGYGFTPPTSRNGVPQPAPDIVRGRSDTAPPTAMGLSQSVSLLETELFRRNYNGETIPVRLARLEQTVFPGDTAPQMSLPDRVKRLMNAVPISQASSSPDDGGKQIAQRRDPDFDMDDDSTQMPRPAPPRSGSGLSRIIGGLGNLITGGGMMMGSGAGYGYPAGGLGGALVTDPQTGLLYDRMSGNLVDPVTGVIVGRRAMPINPAAGYNSRYGANFNNGLTPLGSPYGSGMGFGFGGGGMRFGTGMMGPGAGMIWP